MLYLLRVNGEGRIQYIQWTSINLFPIRHTEYRAGYKSSQIKYTQFKSSQIQKIFKANQDRKTFKSNRIKKRMLI